MIRPNFTEAENAAYNVLKKFQLKSLPVYLYNIVKSYSNLRVRSYTWFAKKNNITIDEVIEIADSESGCCWYYVEEAKYLILYNDTIDNNGHIRWTIAHELGHYLLKHNEKSGKAILANSSLTRKEYDIYEKEANCFARSLLAPPHIILALNKIGCEDIKVICHVSHKAATNISNFMFNGIKMGIRYAKNFFESFHEFIHQKACKQCHHYFVIPNAKYCPVCGGQSIRWRKDEKDMIYDYHQLDQNGKAIVCPRCENEEINPSGEYCKICGAYLINKCLGTYEDNGYSNAEFVKNGCGTLADGNARACYLCGKMTSASWRK